MIGDDTLLHFIGGDAGGLAEASGGIVPILHARAKALTLGFGHGLGESEPLLVGSGDGVGTHAGRILQVVPSLFRYYRCHFGDHHK